MDGAGDVAREEAMRLGETRSICPAELSDAVAKPSKCQ